MAQINVLLVEDESIVAKDLELSLKKFGYHIVASVDNADDAVEIALSKKPDIILMDIRLKGEKTGVDAANEIKEQSQIPIVFLTANTDADTVQKAKITEPHGFIAKPFKEIDLQTSIEMALYKAQKDNELKQERDMLYTLVEGDNSANAFYVKSKSRYRKVPADDFLFVEALKDYVVINTKDTRYTIHSTMKEIASKLPKEQFVRVHRSYIVQINKISAIDYNFLNLEGVEKQIPVGGSYRETVQSVLRFI